jgi:hypothetical protein
VAGRKVEKWAEKAYIGSIPPIERVQAGQKTPGYAVFCGFWTCFQKK